MSSMLLLALVIVAVSGLIAYIGDVVGRKMGRKRLTLMGLRPRHTAVIVSVIAGMLIAALTLLATFAGSQSIRDAFFTTAAQLAALRGELDRTKTALGSAKKEARLAVEELGAAQRNLESTRTLLAQSAAQRQKIQRERAEAEARLASVQTALRGKTRALTAVSAKLERAQAELVRVRDQLNVSRESLKNVSDVVHRLDDEKLRAEEEKLKIEEQVATLREQVDLYRAFAGVGFAPLAFTAGQEILSGVIKTAGDEPGRRVWLREFVKTAEEVVRQRSTELPADAAALIFLGGTGERAQRLSVEDAVQLLSDRIAKTASAEGEVIIRLTPVNHVPVYGPALIAMETLEPIANRRVFEAGDEVARVQLTVDDKTSTAEVLGHLVDDLLRTRVPAVLREKQMVMITRRFDPGDPTTSTDTSPSLVSWADLLAAADRVCSRRGTVNVIARTRAQTTRSGPLNLMLDVEPAR